MLGHGHCTLHPSQLLTLKNDNLQIIRPHALLRSPRTHLAHRAIPPGLRHPAKYSAALLLIFAELLAGCRRVLDPVAGVGKLSDGYQLI